MIFLHLPKYVQTVLHFQEALKKPEKHYLERVKDRDLPKQKMRIPTTIKTMRQAPKKIRIIGEKNLTQQKVTVESQYRHYFLNYLRFDWDY